MRNKFLVILGIEVFAVFLAITLFGLFLLYPHVLDMLNKMEARLEEENRSRAKVIVASVSNRCIEPILDGDNVVLGLIVARAAKDYEGIEWAGITDTEGKIVAHTDLKLVGRKMTMPSGIRPETQDDFASDFYGGYNNALWATYPIIIGESRVGTVHMGMSVDPGIVLGGAQALRKKAVLIYVGLGAISAFLVLLFSYVPIRNLSLGRPKAVSRSAIEPKEKDFAERMAKKRREETEIDERIQNMRNKERELITRIKILKKHTDADEKSDDVEAAGQIVSEKEEAEPSVHLVSEKEKVETVPQFASKKEKAEPPVQPVSRKEKAESPIEFVSEKEKIKAIRKRIHELEERMRGK